MVKIVDGPEPLFQLQCHLGEGPIYDSRTNRLYFVDIPQGRVYTYEPSSGTTGFETFPDQVTFIALREDQPGLIATSAKTIVLIPESSLPFPPTNSTEPKPWIDLTPGLSSSWHSLVNRFNDGSCDPAGRLIAGTTGFTIPLAHGALYQFDAQPAGEKVEDHLADIKDGSFFKEPKMLLEQDQVTCSNGQGFSRDGKHFYFTDSWTRNILKYDYDVTTGVLSNKSVFHTTVGAEHLGWQDGLCLDAEDGLWVCMWEGEKIVRLNQKGEIDVQINLPGCYNVTSCIFGGENMDELYVTSAGCISSGHDQADWPRSGDLYVIKGLGYKGVERHRYRG